MRNLLLRLMYDGTDFHGWQLQPNGMTVQEALQNAAEKILGVRENVTGCSRTDSGVHARDFCCNIRTESDIDCYRFTGALNAVLPEDICVKSCCEVDPDFHARYDSQGKRYVYRVWNANYKNPFLTDYAYPYKNRLDAEFLNGQAQAYVGTHDFKSFCATDAVVETTVREVTDVTVRKEGSEVIISVSGHGFLYNMVRIIAGTLLRVGLGDWDSKYVKEALEAADRSKTGPTLPAQGLLLKDFIFLEPDA